ncbi:MAG: response regulator [Phototrophicaceae bacterium]
MTIRVMIVDDHEIVVRGLSMVLDAFPQFEMVATAQNGQEAIELCAVHQPNVILMDIMMPIKNGIEATRVIRQRHPKTQVVALTSISENPQTIRDILKAGAIAYILKDVTIDTLAQTIESAHSGKSTLANEAMRALVEPDSSFSLTERELEVLSYLVKGWTNRQIADQLILSQSTVKFHVSSLLTKLNAASRTEAVSLALKHKLV